MEPIRDTLRVSRPRLAQRGTCWLQLPWSYSRPLTIVARVLHWQVGRSLFLIRIAVYGRNGARESWRDISACGYSPLAIMLVTGLVALVLFIFGCRKLENGMPFKGLSSYAISAACQLLIEEENAISQRKRWQGLLKGNGTGNLGPTLRIRLVPIKQFRTPEPVPQSMPRYKTYMGRTESRSPEACEWNFVQSPRERG
jgi:hypothetical protein